MKQIFDKNRLPIQPNDCLEVFHFIGARRKRHYMYKWVTVKGGELYALHAGKLSQTESEGYYLWPQADKNGVIADIEVLNDDDREVSGQERTDE